jgi:NAD(P)H dehydrogenase (quinone)
MGKALILYHSKEGNTARMAEYVAEGCRGVDGIHVRVRTVAHATAEDLAWCDGLAVGAPTNLGQTPWEMKRWWDETAVQVWQKVDGKIACAFSSQGGWGGGAEIACQALQTILINFGFLVFGVTDYVASQFTLHYGAIVAGEPREEREQDACRRLGIRLGEWVAVYVDGRHDLHPCRQHHRYPRK